jgi:hypothetical protein
MDEPSSPPPAPAPATPERRDAEGLPLDREPTLDDVRGDGHFGRSTAVGCSLAVLLVIAGFWVLRVLVLR